MRRHGSFRGLAAGALLAALGLAPEAEAQQVELAGIADVMMGIEGGGQGYASGIRRTRTTLRFGLEGYMDEQPLHMPALAVRIELEPAASFGADLRYQLRALDDFTFHAGLSTVLLPKHLIGGTFGAAYRPMLTESLGLYAGPTFEVWFLGADLPADTVLWQAQLEGGLRVAF